MTDSGGAHGVQGDGVGIGDIVDVQGGARGAGVESGTDMPTVYTITAGIAMQSTAIRP